MDETHWDGLPAGAGRSTSTGDSPPQPRRSKSPGPEAGPGEALLNRAAPTRTEVGRRPPSVYDELTGARPVTATSQTKESR